MAVSPAPAARTAARPQPGELCLDHVAHCVRDLDVAAGIFAALGFTLTRRAEWCVGGARAGIACRRAPFAAGGVELRGTSGTGVLAPTVELPPGPRFLAFGTSALDAEPTRLAAHGYAPLARYDIALESDALRVSLLQPAAPEFPDNCMQIVEQRDPDRLRQPEYLEHENGVEALFAAFIAADEPADAGARIARFAGLLPRRAGAFVHLATAHGQVLVGRPADCAGFLGHVPAADCIAGYALACRDPHVLARLCTRAGLEVIRRGPLRHTQLPDAVGGAWVFGIAEDLRRETGIAGAPGSISPGTGER